MKQSPVADSASDDATEAVPILRFQYTLPTLLSGILICAILIQCAVMWSWMYNRNRLIVQRFESLEASVAARWYSSAITRVTFDLESYIENDELSILRDTPDLERLEFRDTNIADADVVHIRPLTGLRVLSLFACSRITDSALPEIATMQHLETLDLGHTRVTDQGLEHLHQMKELRRLYLTGTAVSGAAIHRLKTHLPKLEVVKDYPQ